MKTVVIVDDETAGRSLLKEYLRAYPKLDIIGEASNGIDAVQQINQLQPDLVFLDIQMPGLTGFEVIQQLEHQPVIIFSTAYDKYALQAFEVNAVDYLLKPYTKERFQKAIDKLPLAEEQNRQNIERLVEHLLQNQVREAKYPTTILVQKGQRYVTIQMKDIIWIGAEKDYSALVTKDGKFLSNYGIGSLQEKLSPEQFLRIHRSTIVNIQQVSEVFKNTSSYDIRMANGDVVRVSRSYLDQIKKLTY